MQISVSARNTLTNSTASEQLEGASKGYVEGARDATSLRQKDEQREIELERKRANRLQRENSSRKSSCRKERHRSKGAAMGRDKKKRKGINNRKGSGGLS